MHHKIGSVCMALGAVLVAMALSLFFWNRYTDKQAGESAQQILSQILTQAESDTSANSTDSAADTESVEIDGYPYIGYITIPDLNLELPVMSDWDDTRMKLSPCRYAGAAKTNDLVIAGHNYTRHFGRLSKLSQGDKIYFTDMHGNRNCYAVQAIEALAPTAVEEMTSGEFALTLFTCNYSGQSRIAVRCNRVSEQ